MALYRRSFRGFSISLEQSSITFRGEDNNIWKYNLPNTCVFITYKEIIATTGLYEACTDEEVLIPPTSSATINLLSYSYNCITFTIDNDDLSGGLYVDTSFDGGVTWYQQAGPKVSPRCGISSAETDGMMIRLTSISVPTLHSNILVYNAPVVEITITDYNDGCLFFEIDGHIEEGINVLTSTDLGVTWTTYLGSKFSPNCGFSPVVTTWFKLQSLDNLNNYSNVYIHEIEPEPPVIVIPTEIHLVQSPYYIKYTDVPNFAGLLIVRLYIWHGAYIEKPIEPNYKFTVNGSSYIEVGQYIKDFIQPQPNISYFTNPTSFNELVNFCYEYDIWYKDDNGDYLDFGTFESPLKLATLGYGLHQEGANPIISLTATDGLVTIDSTLITIDSTEYTLDNSGYRTLFNHEKHYHKADEIIYNGKINESSNSSNNIIIRQLTNDYLPVCGGKYKGRHIMYLNKNGFLDTFSFPFAEKRKLKIKNESYSRLIPNPHMYNPAMASKVNLNKEISVEWTFNTGILDIYNIGIIEQIVNSDRHWLIDYDNQTFIPLLISTTDFDEKSRENDRGNIQYTLIFTQGDYKNEMY